jgi:hypothetical protein
MKVSETARGFHIVLHPDQPPSGQESRLVQESSIIGDYEGAWRNAGSSALWIGENHRLCREEVAKLVAILQHWLQTGRLA